MTEAKPAPGGGVWTGPDLLDISSVSAPEIRSILDRALAFRDAGDVQHELLRGKRIANLFFEDSSRTRVSFTMAAHRLGATTTDLFSHGSSISKGETLADTAQLVEANGAHAIVTRTGQSGASKLIAEAVEIPVLNAGDGRHEHPTQGLLDVFALCEARGAGWDLRGVTVAIVGDLANSRVARSDIGTMTALGARVVCVGPTALAPAALTALARSPGSCEVCSDLDGVLGEADAIQVLRIQFERHGAKGASVASPREYRDRFGLTVARAGAMKRGSFVMHPGPFNRGLEIDGEVADGKAGVASLILPQVTAGCFVRMATLAMVMGA